MNLLDASRGGRAAHDYTDSPIEEKVFATHGGHRQLQVDDRPRSSGSEIRIGLN